MNPESSTHPRRAFGVAAFAIGTMLFAALALNACSSAEAESQASPEAASAEPSLQPTATASAQPSPQNSAAPPTKAFCKDLASLLNSREALTLVAAEMNQDPAEMQRALLGYVPELQAFIDGLPKDVPNNIRSTLGQYNTNLQNKIVAGSISVDDIGLIKFTDDDIRKYAVQTCGVKLKY